MIEITCVADMKRFILEPGGIEIARKVNDGPGAPASCLTYYFRLLGQLDNANVEFNIIFETSRVYFDRSSGRVKTHMWPALNLMATNPVIHPGALGDVLIWFRDQFKERVIKDVWELASKAAQAAHPTH